jgi:general secretion pathway protein I
MQCWIYLARWTYMSRKPFATHQAGISLLETLAALVVLSAGATVMFTWFAQNAAVLGKLKVAEEIERVRLEALEYVRTVNPVDRPRGEVTLNQYRLAWTSRQSAETVRTANELGTPARYEISLYELTVRLTPTDGASSDPISQFTLPVAGYKVVESNVGNVFGLPSGNSRP